MLSLAPIVLTGQMSRVEIVLRVENGLLGTVEAFALSTDQLDIVGVMQWFWIYRDLILLAAVLGLGLVERWQGKVELL